MMLCGKQGLYLLLPSSRAHMEAGRLKSSSGEVEEREEMLIWFDFPLGITQ